MRLCPEGWPFVGGGLILAFALTALARGLASNVLGALAGIFFLASAFSAYFFRSPTLAIPDNARWILSPAYGRILEIVEGSDPSAGGPVWILRIFLSVFDVHLQYAPAPAAVRTVRYTKGKFLDARDPQAPFENEQNRIELDLASGGVVVVTQIAGLIARRIICDVQSGRRLRAGERIGLIRFGSQVDVVLPRSFTVRAKVGDRVKAGSTVLAEI